MTTHSHITEIEVRYAETDASKIVWHGSYVAWLEAARTAHIREVGLPYPDLIAAGYGFVVSEVSLRYRQPAVYGDVVAIESHVSKVQSRRMVIDYTLRRKDSNDLLATATTVLIFVTADGQATSMPADYRALLETALL